jgi:hypothetical protein
VDPGISNEDVVVIRFLVGARDTRPIISIARMPPVSDRRNRTGAQIKATTGVGCHGPLSGGGKFFYLRNDRGKWSITGEGQWIG